jgi:hypothetical protein
MLITIDASRITNWETFHDVFAAALGFPDFYGRNMNAWIDCMTTLDDHEPLTAIRLATGEFLTLAIDHIDDLALRCPEIYTALVDCSAFVNWRRIERGAPPVLALSFYKDARIATPGSA